MTGFRDLPYAQQLRDVIRELAVQEIRRLRPGGQLATVSTINADGTCSVIFPGDTDAVPVRMHTIRPSTGGGVGVGDVVRVSGDSTSRRYVTEVVRGSALLNAGKLTLTTLATTASTANMYIDAVTGIVYRSTSSRRYKKDVETAKVTDRAIQNLRPVTFRGRGSVHDDRIYLGLIAEEIAELNDPVLNNLVEYDQEGRPDAVNYDRLAVALLPVVQRLTKRVEELEARMNDQA